MGIFHYDHLVHLHEMVIYYNHIFGGLLIFINKNYKK
jgi:hypothetical protein